MDKKAIRNLLDDQEDEFDGDLIRFAANDFGQPQVILSESISDQDAPL